MSTISGTEAIRRFAALPEPTRSATIEGWYVTTRDGKFVATLVGTPSRASYGIERLRREQHAAARRRARALAMGVMP